ncbi:unnamed protein product [Aphanomyces euteiches]
MSGMSYFKPGTMVGTAVINQNVFIGEPSAEMYWRQSGDWQRVERMIYQAQLNNQMQNQMTQQQRNHYMNMAAASMPRGIPLPPTSELMDQRARSLNHPLDMLCDILEVDRDQTGTRMRQHPNGREMHGMHEPTRFPMMDPTAHHASVMFQQVPTMHGMQPFPPNIVNDVPTDVGESLPTSALMTDEQSADLVADATANVTDVDSANGAAAPDELSSDAAAPTPAPVPAEEPAKPAARPKKRSRNLYIRLDQMKTVLRKHGWKWAEGPLGFIYCKPHVQVSNRGKTISGKEGVDYFSGRAPFEAYVRSQKSLMELIQNELKEKHGGAIFSMEIPPEDQLCAPTYKERAEMARRKQMKAKRLAALALRRSQEAAAAAAAAAAATADSSASTTTSDTSAPAPSDSTSPTNISESTTPNPSDATTTALSPPQALTPHPPSDTTPQIPESVTTSPSPDSSIPKSFDECEYNV